MTAWLWLIGVPVALGALLAVAPRCTPYTSPRERESAAEYLRGLAPSFTASLAEAAVMARLNPNADPERVDAAVGLLGLEEIGDPS